MIEIESPSPEVIEETIKSKESFLIIGISGAQEIMKYCNLIESIIESNNMSCRIITKGRTVTNILLTPVGGTGFALLLAQAAHVIATRNPDWKIIRNLITNKIELRSFCTK